MIHDIDPLVFHNEYRNFAPNEESILITFAEDRLLVCRKEEGVHFPLYPDFFPPVAGKSSFPPGKWYYLFLIQEEKYFLWIPESPLSERAPYHYIPIGDFRTMQPKDRAFAAITAYQLYRWYQNHHFCGKCGGIMEPDPLERMLRCTGCDHLVYPNIAPAVIVGILDGDRILLTRYAGRGYNRYALVAGFAEIGESLEQTVEREVMEEVGLQVKNIRYYKSQPWSLSGTLLSGFFAEVDGSTEITLDETELSEAVWMTRSDIKDKDDGVSLTREMIQAFIDHTYEGKLSPSSK